MDKAVGDNLGYRMASEIRASEVIASPEDKDGFFRTEVRATLNNLKVEGDALTGPRLTAIPRTVVKPTCAVAIRTPLGKTPARSVPGISMTSRTVPEVPRVSTTVVGASPRSLQTNAPAPS